MSEHKDGNESMGLQKEAALRILKGEANPVEPKTVPLTPEEKAVLTGMVVAREAVIANIDLYLKDVIGSRLGLARNRIANADISTGLVTLASDAPKEK